MKRKRRKRRRLYKYGNSDHKSDKETKLYNERIPSSFKNKHKLQWKGDKIDPFYKQCPESSSVLLVFIIARLLVAFCAATTTAPSTFLPTTAASIAAPVGGVSTNT